MMSRQTNTAIFSIIALSLVALVSYSNFVTFKPKLIVPLKEVQGAQTQEPKPTQETEANKIEDKVEVNIPYPIKSEVLGVVKTDRDEQHTIKVPLSPKAVQDFYKNVFKAQGWTVENEGNAGIFLNAEYRKDKAQIKISASTDSAFKDGTLESTKESTLEFKQVLSIVSIEVNQRN